MQTRRFHILKWISLSITILLNGFIVFYSCLPMNVTARWNSSFTNFFTRIINSISKKEVKEIPITDLKIEMSQDKYNFIPGYEANVIPLGSAKEIQTTYSPVDATDKSIIYTTADTDKVRLNQNGTKLSVVGLKEGTATIVAKNNKSGIEKSLEVYVVETIAPVNFDISCSKTEIELGSYADIVFDIDGGPLGHNALYNSRYYDIRELSYSSSNPSVLSVDKLGVVHPISSGTSTISVSNGTTTRSIDFTVVSGSTPVPYANLKIDGNNSAFENDFINNAHHQTLEIYDGTTKLNNSGFEWSSSNELLVNVDQTGTIRGFRKSTSEDETAVIRATSKITNQYTEFTVVIKEQLPTTLVYEVATNNKSSWSPEIYTTCVGDNTKIVFYLQPSVQNTTMTINSSDTEVINPVFQGKHADLDIKKPGKCTISFYYNRDPNLKGSVEFTVLNAGALNSEEIIDTGYTLRKVVGHAALFMVAQISTIITIFMFLRKKPIWLKAIISVSIGLFFAIISEVIELFVPQRSGKVLDVLIDFSGVAVGALLFVLSFLIYKKTKNSRIMAKTKK